MSDLFGNFDDFELGGFRNNVAFEDFRKAAASKVENDDDNMPKELLDSPNISTPPANDPSTTNNCTPKVPTRTRRSAHGKKIDSVIAAAAAILDDSFATPKAPSRGKRSKQKKANSTIVVQVAPTPPPPPKNTRRTRRNNRIEAQPNLIGPLPQPIVIQDIPVPTTVNNAFIAIDRRMQNTDINNTERRNLHRSAIGEIAARSKTVGYVDLVSSPMPRIEGVINVDSDDERKQEQNNATAIENNNLDQDFDPDNPEVSVKIIWCNGKPETFPLRRHQKFAEIFNIFAERVGKPIGNIVFDLNNKFLMPSDTPAGINYKIFQFIHGRVLENDLGLIKTKKSSGRIKLKVQSDRFKRPVAVELLKTDKFKILYIKCAEELKMPYQEFKLSFDGDLLELDDTPLNLEFEGGEVIDIRFKK